MAKTKIKSKLYISRLEGSDNYYVSCHPGEPSIVVPNFDALKRKMARLASYNPSIFYETPMVTVYPYDSGEHARIYRIFNQISRHLNERAMDFARRPALSNLEKNAASESPREEPKGVLVEVN